MSDLKRFTVRVPYTETIHGEALLEIEGSSEETAKCEAMAIVRSTTNRPIIHDPEILATVELEVVGD